GVRESETATAARGRARAKDRTGRGAEDTAESAACRHATSAAAGRPQGEDDDGRADRWPLRDKVGQCCRRRPAALAQERQGEGGGGGVSGERRIEEPPCTEGPGRGAPRRAGGART